MKKILTVALALSSFAALAQQSGNVGIGTKNPDPSALLDLSSTTKGLLLPRMTQAQRDAIKNPVAGLIVYQTDQAIGTYTYNGTTWQPSNAKIGEALGTGAWDLNGNPTADNSNFLGVPSGVKLTFKIGTSISGLADATAGNAFFGPLSGANNNGTGNTAIGNQAMQYSSASASGNVALGNNALRNNQVGSNNLAIGTNTLLSNNGGFGNVAIGNQSMTSNQGGYQNMGIGENTLFSLTGGNGNVAIGAGAMFSTTGNSNVAIGSFAGQGNNGSGNLFLGFNAGQNETTGSNLLYISNSGTANPLIKGSFHATAPWIKFNVKAAPGSPTPTTTGYLAIGDFDTAPGGAGAGGLGLPSNFVGGAYRLYVQDGIMTEKLKVALRNSADWADYVFAPDYKLAPLEEVETFIKANNHLPNVPSATEMASSGLDFVSTTAKLMEKIEELTLYVIELKKEIKQLKSK